MARIDPVIDRLFREAGLELVLQSGVKPFVRTHRGRVEVLRHPLSGPQILAAITEIVPADLAQGFPREGTTRFSYPSPNGPTRIRLDRWGERVRATIAPELGEEDESMGVFDSGDAEEATSNDPDPLRSVTIPDTRIRVIPPPPSPEPPVTKAPAPTPAAAARTPSVPVAPPAGATEAMEGLLKEMLARRASDLHLSSDTVPMFRVDGDITAHESARPLPAERVKAMLWSIVPPRNREEWERRHDTDFAHETPHARFRVNVFADRKGIGAVIRQIPNTIRSAEDLGLSKAILDLCHLQKGLVLVTGPTGSGKSTTLAAMIDHINRSRSDHVITIEDPIEFVHQNHRCLMNQREVGTHTDSFKNALRAALREDPDVVLVGELRDLETIAIAIETAETGHLVFGTLHTNTAPSTVDRIIDQFPPDQQAQIRTLLGESLKGVIAQTLCKRVGGGRVAAHEILLCTGGVSNMIREGKTHQLASVIQTGRGVGMVTLNDSLLELVKKGWVAPEEALKRSAARGELRSMLERAGVKLDPAAEQRAA